MSEAGQNGRETAQSSGGYRVLARKYRPRSFSDLIGQEPMVRTLTNAFEADRIAQAWMLTGVRGVGKTTTARILARALNYKTETVDRPSVAFDGLGEHCQAIMEGRHVDVIEMDAASHTGIDDIRDIIEQVRYAPVSARYKVYIIDEVHMLSTQAFNGLLKTLEEPPPHVKFIFATTEIRKVPITVLSRCQRFDLRRIDAGLIAADLARIGALEGVEAEKEALTMIARAAEGSMRDAQSIFDQAIAHSAGKVTAETVRDMLGLADRARVIDLFEKLMSGDIAGALEEFRDQYDAGADPAVTMTDLAEFCHLVTRMKFVPSAAADASLTEEERRRGGEFAGKLQVRVLSRTWQMLLKAISEVDDAARPATAAEMALIRIAHAADLPTLDEAIRMATDAKSAGDGGGARSRFSSSDGGGAASVRGPSAVSSGGAAARRMPEAEGETAPLARLRQEPEAAVPVASLEDIVALAERHRDIKLNVSVKQYVRLVRIEPGQLVIGLAENAPGSLPTELSTRLREWTGRNWLVSLSRDEPGQRTLAEQEAGKRESALLDARSDPTVAAYLARFPGAKIIDVRIPEAAADKELEIEIEAQAAAAPDEIDEDGD
ncbi:MAG: DNA polymerase III subunit gamma/tau [Rhizobiaceae bacterium]|nr:DNA polymerase III subunit gamma/tau [Rhizobiaceae bacterium]MCV0405056.1 DNA polymerase III subunit gamma/tau [Rhizobiaceae bacterium]